MSKKLRIDPEALMAEYRAAFLAANGTPVFIAYKRGWYQIGAHGMKPMHRARQVEYYAATLRARVELSTPTTKGTDA